MKRTIFIYASLVCLFSCSVEKTAATKENVFEPCPQTSNTSVGSEWQHEQAVIMRSWTQEQRDEFRRKYVYSEVNFIMNNGDTLTIK
jgi:hypothetical protein